LVKLVLSIMEKHEKEALDEVISQINEFMMELSMIRFAVIELRKKLKKIDLGYDPNTDRDIIAPGEGIKYYELVKRVQMKYECGVNKAKKKLTALVNAGIIVKEGEDRSPLGVYKVKGKDEVFI
jgi:hypothetical protein